MKSKRLALLGALALSLPLTAAPAPAEAGLACSTSRGVICARVTVDSDSDKSIGITHQWYDSKDFVKTVGEAGFPKTTGWVAPGTSQGGSQDIDGYRAHTTCRTYRWIGRDNSALLIKGAYYKIRDFESVRLTVEC